MKIYDAVVVGAGPGGATAARDLALKGLDVLIIEKFELPRHKACGGGLTGNVGKYLDFDISSTVENHVTKTLFLFNGKYKIDLTPKGLNVGMIHRNLFDKFLTDKAVEAGAELRTKTSLKNLVRDNDCWIVSTSDGELRARTIVGADGAASTTARKVGLRTEAKMGYSMDADIKVPSEVYEEWKETAVFDFGIVPRGYGWSFPKGDVFSIGVGTTNQRFKDVKAQLDGLISRHECLREYSEIEKRAAPLPFWTHHEPLARDGVFLVGDAAGLVDPLSGEGISYAVRSAHSAADCIDSYLNGEPNQEQAYSDRIYQEITRGFEMALRMGDIFFSHPVICFLLGVRSQKVNDIFARLISGEIDYVQVYNEVAASLPGRCYRAIKPLLRRRAA